jgi:hypothetical protein
LFDFELDRHGYGREEDRRCTIESGFDRPLVKPQAMDDLAKASSDCRNRR